MKDEFNLSEEIVSYGEREMLDGAPLESVKEFIRRLKESLCLGGLGDVIGKDNCVICNTIDKLAGDELK